MKLDVGNFGVCKTLFGQRNKDRIFQSEGKAGVIMNSPLLSLFSLCWSGKLATTLVTKYIPEINFPANEAMLSAT